MKNKGKKLLLLVTAACCAAFGVYSCLGRSGRDREAPVISMAQSELRLSVTDEPVRLLDGVTAADAHDGDVTASLVVESVRGMVSDRRFTVTYAAFDAAGNVAKAQRTVCYEDYVSPRFSLSAPLVFRAGVMPDVFSVVGAADVFDGDLSDRVKGTLVSGERQLSEAGEYAVSFRVTNSLGDTAYLTAPVLVTEGSPGTAGLTLRSYLVYLRVGEPFSPETYLLALQAGERTVSLQPLPEGASVQTAGEVNTAVPGVYCVDYTVTCGADAGRTRLLVVVEE